MWNFVWLVLAVLVSIGGAYYEFSTQQKALVDTRTQVTVLQGKIEVLQAGDKKTEEETKALTKSVADEQGKEADLTAKLSTLQSALAEKDKALDLALHPPAPVVTAPPPPPPDPNDLGTVKTVDGKIFEKCHLLKVNPDGIVMNHSKGITQILFLNLPADLQHHFGFDAATQTVLTEPQLEAAEAVRIAGPISAAPAPAPEPAPASPPPAAAATPTEN